MELFKWIADLFVFDLLGLAPEAHLTHSLHFFIEDVLKIFAMVVLMIYLVGVFRAGFDLNKVRQRVEKLPRLLAYAMSAVFGAITPFCSCSSIPFFLGFTKAGIPAGVTFAFLITSPLVNEVALVLLGGILGFKFMVIYVAVGLGVGILGGIIFDFLKADDHLQDLAIKVKAQQGIEAELIAKKLTFADRHQFAVGEVKEILKRISKWIFIGVGVGALLHGFVPQEWVTAQLGDKSWWSVPAAVLLGIPLYSNASGMIPIVETLLAKGLPIGTALALMMSTVGASFPEFVLLKQVVKPKMLGYLFIYFLVSFTLVGWILNLIF